MLGETELVNYTVKSWSIEKMNNGISVTLVLGRKILNAFLTTYLPTILLMIIVHSTNYYKDFFFEAIVTVNLTGMLVLSTMFVSVSSNLPVTSDIKIFLLWGGNRPPLYFLDKMHTTIHLRVNSTSWFGFSDHLVFSPFWPQNSPPLPDTTQRRVAQTP